MNITIKGLALGIIVISLCVSCMQHNSVDGTDTDTSVFRKRAGCIRMVRIGMDNYIEIFNCMPSNIVSSDGKPLLSWRVAMASYVRLPCPLLKLDESWDANYNAKEMNDFIIGKSLAQYENFSSSTRDIHENSLSPPYFMSPFHYDFIYKNIDNKQYSFRDDTTNILAIVGEGTAFDVVQKDNWQQFPDNLLLFIEVGNSTVQWAEPSDVSIDDLKQDDAKTRYNLSCDSNGFMVCFWDGKIFNLKSTTPFSILVQFANIETARSSDREKILSKYILIPIVREF